MSPRFVHESRFEASCDEVFRWHARPGALERLNPPWERVEVEERGSGIAVGSRVALRVRLAPFVSARWVAEHVALEEGRRFEDVQVAGPFARWHHVHELTPDGAGACRLRDTVEYELPFGALGTLLAGGLAGGAVRRRLRRMFEHRHRTLALDLETHRRNAMTGTQKIAITGSSGLVGSALIPLLETAGHEVVRLVRRPPQGPGEVRVDPAAGEIDDGALEGLDAVVHLAGENIASRRWSDEQKKRIRDSRVGGTHALCDTLAGLERPPRCLVSASAVGFYGDRGAEVVDETSARGAGFLADVCAEWERATEPAEQAGIRVVHTRFGVILSPSGGALAKMLTPFKLGAGGVIGSGDQVMSWIDVDDVAGAILHALSHEDVRAATNVVAPNPVTNREFTKTLGRVLHRPTFVPMPAPAAKLAFGEMANELLLSGQRVKPAVLERTGYAFRYPRLEDSLRHLLGRPSAASARETSGAGSR